jgi:cation diffusion facilitator family transporter
MTKTVLDVVEREKRRVALSSVIAAVFLTGMKIVVGLLTHSLGILAEASHSGLDLIAAGVTYLAVRASGRPPDTEHNYGHGKVENLSAMVETLLLLGTCAWIVYEAIHRLFFQEVSIEVTYWSFIVMLVSIAIDLTRSRALMKIAKRHNSQALEADALHFSTDVWSSTVVIFGLIAVFIGQKIGSSSPTLARWLSHADAIAALGVSVIVIYVSIRLGRHTINALLDSAPKGMSADIEREVSHLSGVAAVRRIRTRQSGPATFVDVTLAVPRTTSFEEAHSVATRAEALIQRLLPRSDVMVHIDPIVDDEKSLVETIRSVAARNGMNVHSLQAHDVGGHMSLDMHAEVPDNLTVMEAHNRITALEDALKKESPELDSIIIHIEPVGDKEVRQKASPASSKDVQDEIKKLSFKLPSVIDCHNISIFHYGNELSVSFHCTLAPNLPILEAHELTIEMENLLREHFTQLKRVIIHVEPPDPDTAKPVS